MANEKLCLKDYIKCVDDKTLSKTRKKMNKKSHKGRYYGGAEGRGVGNDSGGDGGGGGGMGESVEPILNELLNGVLPGVFSANVLNIVQTATRAEEEEQETTPRRGGMGKGAGTPKIDRARPLFQGLVQQPDITRGDIIEAFKERLGVTHSTAVSYFQRLAKEAGLTHKFGGKDEEGGMVSPKADDDERAPATPGEEDLTDELPDEGEDEDEGKGGEPVIRTVDNAHLVYKRQNPEGSYDELWVYNVSDDMNDELEIRRAILAGTDIPPKKTRSEDRSQKYNLTTLGNAQLLHITGLPN